MLAVVTCLFNPLGYERPLLNYSKFRAALEREPVVIELCFGDQASQLSGNVCTIRAGFENWMWQKERLMKLAIESLPPEVDKVAIIDADIIFTNPFWAEQAEELLDTFPVVQLCERLHSMDRYGRTAQTGKTIGWRVSRDAGGYSEWFHTGGFWAGQREVIYSGLYDHDILGGGDASMAFAWLGEPERNVRHRKYSPAWTASYEAWAAEQYKLVGGQIGCVTGDAVHLWHGDKAKRQYVERHQIAAANDFNPHEDIRLNADGLWEWCTNKPQLHNAVRKYFVRREEDG